jgi:hypothetical protein
MKHNKLVECKSVPCYLPENIAKEIDELVTTLSKECSYIKKAYVADYQFEPGERAEVSIITTETKDKENEVIKIDGLDLDKMRRNGTVFWYHDYDKPIGTCQWIKPVGKSIKAKTIYPEAPDGNEDGWVINKVWQLISSTPPVIKAKSIGALALTPKRQATPEELADHPDWADAAIYDRTMCLEYSVCPMGMNNDALVECVNNKSVDVAELRKMGIDTDELTKHIFSQNKADDWYELIKADTCVAKKLKHLYNMGEDKDKSQKQLIAIAYAYCKADKAFKKKPQKNITKVMADALDAMELDVDKIVQQALHEYKNRNRV